MKHYSKFFASLCCIAVSLIAAATFSGRGFDASQQVAIPLAGNAYLTGGQQSEGITKRGINNWHSASNIYSVFFKLSREAEVKVSILGKVEAGTSRVRLSTEHTGQERSIQTISADTISFGTFRLSKGYNRIDIEGLSKSGDTFAQISHLMLDIPQNQKVFYVKDNKANHFYWGRRGPSVHLKYEMPSKPDIEWFYSELTVASEMDPVGSYFMANGFGEGYFGIQVNAPNERRVLFSVWSPYQTDNPEEIPESQRIKLLKKGKDVNTGTFGNEGSGGQSYWKFNWQAGQIYRFLTRIKPDENGNTTYTSYFYAPELGQWKLIASFLRPQTDSWVSRPHSFLENFVDNQGFKTRKAKYGNQWVRDKSGRWHELNKATFTGDNIASIGFRKDFKSGTARQSFFLQNGGFFDADIALGTSLKRQTTGQPPKIDFDSLP